MSAALEVSEGYPLDGRPFEPPQINRNNEQPRYITFVGSVIEATSAMDRPWTKGGGIEIGNPCLRYTKHYVRKGRITPVLKDVHDWVTQDYWEKATGRDASYFQRQIPSGYVAPANESGYPSPIKAMYGKVAVPGEQMDSILNGSANILDRTRRGVVELTELVGHDYRPENLGNGIVTDATIWQIQRAIFPDYPFILKDGRPTVLLDDIEEVLIDAQRNTSIRSIVDKYLTSLSQFRDYAKGSVDQTHYRMRESAVKSEAGYIWKYTELDFVLMEQLGVSRQDREIRSAATRVESDPELRDMFKQFIALQIEEKQANVERMKGVGEVVPAITESTMAAAPIAAPIVEPKVYTCEHCGEEVKLSGKGLHIGRHCKVLHAKVEVVEPPTENQVGYSGFSGTEVDFWSGESKPYAIENNKQRREKMARDAAAQVGAQEATPETEPTVE
jgi:hypothetical protein